MSSPPVHTVTCNGATSGGLGAAPRHLTLDYRNVQGRNLKLNLPDFARSAGFLSSRVLDLIEIAAYIHAGDRLVGRGASNAVELHGWQRRFLYRVRVRDYEFWNRDDVKRALSEAITFMTGDYPYTFEFEAGHVTLPTSLFDSEQFQLSAGPGASVALFSGGLDSLVGALDQLTNTVGTVYLVSHSAQSGIKRTQTQLVAALEEHFPGRVRHYKFDSHLSGIKAREETQRSRSLLFGSIAFSIARSLGQRSFYLFENGITGINFPRRQSLMNARASRTTHPKTVHHLQKLFSLVEGSEVEIRNPLLYLTKTDVVQKLRDLGHPELYPSSVSCGVTRSKSAPATHCGGCNQCIDRRFAAYASGLDSYDDRNLYERDFLHEGLKEAGKHKSLLDFLRQAVHFKNSNTDEFEDDNVNGLVDLFGYLPGISENDGVSTVEAVSLSATDMVSRFGRGTRR